MALLFDTWKKWRNKIMAGKLKETLKEMKETNAESAESILKYLKDNDIIDLSYVQKQIEMANNEKLLRQHPYKISQGSDGFWRTYLPDDTKDSGRRMVKKKTETEVKKAVIVFWKVKAENPTLQEVFEEWNDRRLELKKISSSTHERNGQIFRRHYSEFGERKIKTVEPEEFEDFLEEQIPEHDLSAKAFSNLKSVTRGFLKRAKKRKLIEWSPDSLFQDIDTSDADFKKIIREDDEEVFVDDELPVVLEYLENNLDLKNIGILLMFITGVRVGELVTLKHSDFEGNTVKIRRTETRVLVEKGKYEYRVKDFPKSKAGVRTVIIPRDFTWLVQRIAQINPNEEYVFVTAGKRMTTNCIRRRMKRMCTKLGIKPKSPHKARRTYASILCDNDIDKRLITDVMGHTDIQCTENYYHKNRKDINKKLNIISQIPEFRVQ